MQNRPSSAIQSVDNPHYFKHPLHETITASESDPSDEGEPTRGGEESVTVPQAQTEGIRYQGVHPINRQTVGKQTEMLEERAIGESPSTDSIYYYS